MIEINLYLLVILVICILLWLTFTKEDENVLIKRYLWKFKVYASSVAFMFLSKVVIMLRSDPFPVCIVTNFTK